MRNALIFIAALLLSACATTHTPQTGFSQSQRDALIAAGFEPVDDNFELGLADKILFDFDSSELNTASEKRLHELGRMLLDIGIARLTIEGHTDALGRSRYNTELSGRRADAVRAALVSAGMEPRGLFARAKGESEPVQENDTLEGRAENRRVVIIVSSDDLS